MNKFSVIVPAAGLGTRMLPISKSVPKEILPIISKPAIEYIAEEIVQSSLDNMILITSKNKDALIDHFDRNIELENICRSKNLNNFDNLDVINIRQKVPLGSGHAIYTAKNICGIDPIIVILPDMIIKNAHVHLTKMIDLYNRTGKMVIALMKVPENMAPQYGIVRIEKDDDLINIIDIVEKPKSPPSNLAVVGRYILPYEIFNILSTLSPGLNNEIQLTDAIRELMYMEGCIGYIIEDSNTIHDIGNPLGYIKANISFALDDESLRNEVIDFINKIILN